MLKWVLEKKFYFFSIFLWTFVVTVKLKYNGLLYGFDYSLYQPDGKYYTYMALEFVKSNPILNAEAVVQWYESNAVKLNTFSINEVLPQTSYVYPLISYRVLYPFLSAPFVAALGIPGMLVIPSLSLLVVMLTTQFIAYKAKLPLFGFILVFLLVDSITVMRWMIVNCTDSLLTALFALVALVLFKIEKVGIRFYFILLTLIALTSMTRFVLPFWLAISVVLYISKGKKSLSFLVFLFSFICSIPALYAQSTVSILPVEGSSSTLLKLVKIPIYYVKVLAVDVVQLAVLDRVLLILIVMGIFLSIINFRHISSQYFLSMFIAGYLIGAINGTIGVNFRYQMPVIPFCAWAIIEYFQAYGRTLFLGPFSRIYVKVKKTQEKL